MILIYSVDECRMLKMFVKMHWFCAILQDIPSLTAEAAKEHPGVSYMVTAPLGLHELLVVCNVCIFFWAATVNC